MPARYRSRNSRQAHTSICKPSAPSSIVASGPIPLWCLRMICRHLGVIAGIWDHPFLGIRMQEDSVEPSLQLTDSIHLSPTTSLINSRTEFKIWDCGCEWIRWEAAEFFLFSPFVELSLHSRTELGYAERSILFEPAADLGSEFGWAREILKHRVRPFNPHYLWTWSRRCRPKKGPSRDAGHGALEFFLFWIFSFVVRTLRSRWHGYHLAHVPIKLHLR